MAHKHTRGPRRGQCGACPAKKDLAFVEVAPGRKLNLCAGCRKALRKLQRTQDRNLVKNDPSKGQIVSASDAGDLEGRADDLPPGRAEAMLDTFQKGFARHRHRNE